MNTLIFVQVSSLSFIPPFQIGSSLPLYDHSCQASRDYFNLIGFLYNVLGI